MKPDRPFEEILKDMQACIENWDTEDAHGKADDLLEEVALCSHLVTQERWEIVQAYRKVKKWYA